MTERRDEEVARKFTETFHTRAEAAAFELGVTYGKWPEYEVTGTDETEHGFVVSFINIYDTPDETTSDKPTPFEDIDDDELDGLLLDQLPSSWSPPALPTLQGRS